MNGGYETLKDAYEAVKADIPLLVFKGTGQAANLIAAAYKNFKEALVLQLYNAFPYWTNTLTVLGKIHFQKLIF